ncbi:hypothetical protein [Nocardiopsis sp. FIRDI 009]|uniref:CdiA C-terminal domain-containing protein n=1 Tax=Nocardiopsis sp. FIRDI 009 TaxID=714197 RepID=UPI000E230B8C|nr:hypothetical protein [Nocardiopsis sp. FIRDI 009]
MSDGIIDPDEIPVPIVNTVLLESAASGIRTDGENIAAAGQDIKSTWAGLQEFYSAPEASELFAAVDPVATTGDGVETDFAHAATALEDFAETARYLRSQLVEARQEAKDLVAKIQNDEDWDEGGFFGGESELVEEHNNLLNRVNSLHNEYQAAERECANAITTLFGGTTFIASNAEGTTQPGDGEAVYGFEEAPEDVEAPWGTPQGTDHMWHVDALHGGWDVLSGSLEDMGGAVGAHGSEGWWDGGWWNNFSSYWGDSIEGLGAMTGFYNPQTGEMVNSTGEWWDTARGAWGDAIHGFFPWTELGERPGYVVGTVATNIAMIAGGAALSATGYGAVVGVPVIGARVSRILGGAGTGDGPISGDIDAGGTDGSRNGSSNNGSNGTSSSIRPDGTHPDAPTAPDHIESDGSDHQSGIGDMNDTLNDLEDYQHPAPRPDPTPTPDTSPDPRSDSAPGDEATPERSDGADSPQRDNEAPQGTPQDANSPNRGADEDTQRDLTTEEADAAFAEIARRNEDVADNMDRVDDGQMAELDGSERWTMGALEDSGSNGRGDVPDQGNEARVPVTPDGMEMRSDNDVNNSVDGGEGPRLDGDDDPVTIHESQDPRPVDPTTGGPPSGGTPEPPTGPGMPESRGPFPESPDPSIDPPGDQLRLLGDFDNAVPHDRLPRPEDTAPPKYNQPTVDELRDRIGEGWEYYDDKERAIAEYLREHGIEVQSVDVARSDGIKSPDSVVVGRDVTIEFKTPETASKNAIIQNLRKGREQSSRIVIDVRSVNTPQETSMSALRDSLRRYGGDIEEVLIIGSYYVISWP